MQTANAAERGNKQGSFGFFFEFFFAFN